MILRSAAASGGEGARSGAGAVVDLAGVVARPDASALPQAGQKAKSGWQRLPQQLQVIGCRAPQRGQKANPAWSSNPQPTQFIARTRHAHRKAIRMGCGFAADATCIACDCMSIST